MVINKPKTMLMKPFKPLLISCKRSRLLSAATKYFLYGVLRLLFMTYRIKVTLAPGANRTPSASQGIYYFWHQHIVAGMYYFFKTKSTGACIASPSNDGKIAGFLCKKLGFDVLYGSSNKSSIAVLRAALTALRTNGRLCLVGDGSRGPAFQLQPGLEYLATKASLPLVFVECTVSHAITFKKSWDQFKLPLPFSTIYITIHQPVNITPECLKTGQRHHAVPS
jgi:lysophospholipid acyltransferase (LPLAT)-like uncharacterized protein